jgi:hypothetical protein
MTPREMTRFWTPAFMVAMVGGDDKLLLHEKGAVLVAAELRRCPNNTQVSVGLFGA